MEPTSRYATPTTDDPKLHTEVNSRLPLPVDCVAWNHRYDLLAIGGYKLMEPEQVRVGKLFIVSCCPTIEFGFKIVEEVELSGVLDMKWEPDVEDHLAVACATCVSIFVIDPERGDPLLVNYGTHHLPTGTLALYIEWMDMKRVIFSDSEGCIHIMGVEIPLKVISVSKVQPTLTWVVHFDKFNDVVYAGNDEGKLTAFPLKDIDAVEKHYNKKFRVGVISIITKAYFVAVGS